MYDKIARLQLLDQARWPLALARNLGKSSCAICQDALEEDTRSLLVEECDVAQLQWPRSGAFQHDNILQC